MMYRVMCKSMLISTHVLAPVLINTLPNVSKRKPFEMRAINSNPYALILNSSDVLLKVTYIPDRSGMIV